MTSLNDGKTNKKKVNIKMKRKSKTNSKELKEKVSKQKPEVDERKEKQKWEANRRKRFNNVIEDLRKALDCEPCPKVEVIQSAIAFVNSQKCHIAKDKSESVEDAELKEESHVEKLKKQNLILTFVLKEAGIKIDIDKLNGEVVYYIPVLHPKSHDGHKTKRRKVMLNVKLLKYNNKNILSPCKKKSVDRFCQTDEISENGQITLSNNETNYKPETDNPKISSKHSLLNSKNSLLKLNYNEPSSDYNDSLTGSCGNVESSINLVTLQKEGTLPIGNSQIINSIPNHGLSSEEEQIIVEEGDKNGALTVKLITGPHDSNRELHNPNLIENKCSLFSDQLLINHSSNIGENCVFIPTSEPHHLFNLTESVLDVAADKSAGLVNKQKMIVLKYPSNQVYKGPGNLFVPQLHETQFFVTPSLSQAPIMSPGVAASLAKASFTHTPPYLYSQTPIICNPNKTYPVTRLKRIAPKPTETQVVKVYSSESQQELRNNLSKKRTLVDTTLPKGKKSKENSEKSNTIIAAPDNKLMYAIKSEKCPALSTHVDENDELDGIIDLPDDMPCIPENIQGNDLEANGVSEERLVEMLYSMDEDDRTCNFSPPPSSHSFDYNKQENKEKENVGSTITDDNLEKSNIKSSFDVGKNEKYNSPSKHIVCTSNSCSESYVSATCSNYSIMSLCMPSKTEVKTLESQNKSGSVQNNSLQDNSKPIDQMTKSKDSKTSDNNELIASLTNSSESKHNSSMTSLSVSSLISQNTPISETTIKNVEIQPILDLQVPVVNDPCASTVSLIPPSLYLHPPPFPTPPLPPIGLPSLPLPTLPSIPHNISYTCISSTVSSTTVSSSENKTAKDLNMSLISSCSTEKTNKKLNLGAPKSVESTHSSENKNVTYISPMLAPTPSISSSDSNMSKSIFSLAPITSYTHPFPFCALSLSDSPTTFSFTLTRNPSITSSASEVFNKTCDSLKHLKCSTVQSTSSQSQKASEQSKSSPNILNSSTQPSSIAVFITPKKITESESTVSSQSSKISTPTTPHILSKSTTSLPLSSNIFSIPGTQLNQSSLNSSQCLTMGNNSSNDLSVGLTKSTSNVRETSQPVFTHSQGNFSNATFNNNNSSNHLIDDNGRVIRYSNSLNMSKNLNSVPSSNVSMVTTGHTTSTIRSISSLSSSLPTTSVIAPLKNLHFGDKRNQELGDFKLPLLPLSSYIIEEMPPLQTITTSLNTIASSTTNVTKNNTNSEKDDFLCSNQEKRGENSKNICEVSSKENSQHIDSSYYIINNCMHGNLDKNTDKQNIENIGKTKTSSYTHDIKGVSSEGKKDSSQDKPLDCSYVTEYLTTKTTTANTCGKESSLCTQHDAKLMKTKVSNSCNIKNIIKQSCNLASGSPTAKDKTEKHEELDGFNKSNDCHSNTASSSASEIDTNLGKTVNLLSNKDDKSLVITKTKVISEQCKEIVSKSLYSVENKKNNSNDTTKSFSDKCNITISSSTDNITDSSTKLHNDNKIYDIQQKIIAQNSNTITVPTHFSNSVSINQKSSMSKDVNTDSVKVMDSKISDNKITNLNSNVSCSFNMQSSSISHPISDSLYNAPTESKNKVQEGVNLPKHFCQNISQPKSFVSNCETNSDTHGTIQLSNVKQNNEISLTVPQDNGQLNKQISPRVQNPNLQIQEQVKIQQQQRINQQTSQLHQHSATPQQIQQFQKQHQPQQQKQATPQQYSVNRAQKQQQQPANLISITEHNSKENNSQQHIPSQPNSGPSQQVIIQQQLVQNQSHHQSQTNQQLSHLQILNAFESPIIDSGSERNIKQHSGQHHNSSNYTQHPFEYNPYYRKPPQSPRSDSIHQCYSYKQIQQFQQDVMDEIPNQPLMHTPFLEDNDDDNLRDDDSSTDHVRGFSVSHLVSPFTDSRKQNVIAHRDHQNLLVSDEKVKEPTKKSNNSRKVENKSRGSGLSKGNAQVDSRRRSPARSIPVQHSNNTSTMWSTKQNGQKHVQNYSAEALISSQNYARSHRQSSNFIPQNQMYQTSYSSQQMKNFVPNSSFAYGAPDRGAVYNTDYNFPLHSQTSGPLTYGPNVPYMGPNYPYQNLPSSSTMLSGDFMPSHHPGPYPRLHDINSEHTNFPPNATFPLPLDPQDMCGGPGIVGPSSSTVRVPTDAPFSISSSPSYSKLPTSKNNATNSSGKRLRYVDTTMMGSGMSTPTNFLDGCAISHIPLHSFTPPCEDATIVHSNYLTGSTRHQSNFFLGPDNFVPLNTTSQYPSSSFSNSTGNSMISSNETLTSNAIAMGPPVPVTRGGVSPVSHMLPHGTPSSLPFNSLRANDRQQMNAAPLSAPTFSSSLSNFNLTSIFPEIDGKTDETDSSNRGGTQMPNTDRESSIHPPISVANSDTMKSSSNVNAHIPTNSINNIFHHNNQVGINPSMSPTPSSFSSISFTPSQH